MEHCKDCVWWKLRDQWGSKAEVDGWGWCSLLSRTGEGYSERFEQGADPPQLAYASSSEWTNGIYTAPEFGCVQFEGKDDGEANAT